MAHSPENFSAQSPSESTGGGWDELAKISFRGGVEGDLNDQAPQPEDSPEAKQEKLRAEVRNWGDIYCDTERDFAKYTKQADRSTPEGQEKYKNTLLKYEDEVAWDWNNLRSSVNVAKKNGLLKSYYEEAAASRVGGDGFPDSEVSVEAACGIFYQERMDDLVAKIDNSSLDDQERQSQRQLLGQTWKRVSDYLDAVADLELRNEDEPEYRKFRNFAHGRMIEQLNKMNDLARAHGTKPFTPRNFIDGEKAFDKRFDFNRVLTNRSEYDRNTVMSYFRTVFTRDFEINDRVSLHNEVNKPK